jgi:hypothetical protein
MIDQARGGPRCRYTLPLALLAVASFLLYAAGVLMLRQDRAPGWALEAEAAFPAAVSYLIYGTKLAAVDNNVWERFMHPNGMSVQEVLALTASKSIPPGPVDPTTTDGTGAGTDLFAIVAMAMFGMNILSLVLLYLLMTGIAAVAFALRYRDRRMIVIPLYFLAVTVMLLTPLGSSSAAVDQVPIGGQRYFVLAAFLPALHIFFEIVDSSPAAEARRTAHLLLLFVQTLLLFGALLVRSSTGYLVMVLLAAWAWRLYRERGQPAQLRVLLCKAGVSACACALSIAFVVTALPAYVHSGRLFGNFWHRAFSTLSVHPDWPFGNLAKVYDCTKYLPQGLSRKIPDANGQCVWLAYPPNAKRPPGDVNRDLYGGEYEKVVRQAYFYVLAHYPRQVFETYAFLKSGMIGHIITAAWDDLFELPRAPVPKGLFAAAAAQVLVFVAFVICVLLKYRSVIDWQMAIFPICFLFSLAPLYVAMASFATTLDTVFLMYSCLILAVLLGVQLVAQAIPHRAPKTSRAQPASAHSAPKTTEIESR